MGRIPQSARDQGTLARSLRDQQGVAPMQLPAGVTYVCGFHGHTNSVGNLAWSADGRLLASPSKDTTVCIWDVEADTCVRVLDAPGAVRTAVFDARGDRVLAAGTWDSL